MDNVTKNLELYLVKKAPKLPTKFKDFLVKFMPWLIILGVVITLPALTALFGLGSMYNMMYGRYAFARVGFGYTLVSLFLLASCVLKIIAIPGLFSKTKNGWNMLYYAVLLNAVYSLLNLDLLSILIGTTISLYLLFQVKTYYKK